MEASSQPSAEGLGTESENSELLLQYLSGAYKAFFHGQDNFSEVENDLASNFGRWKLETDMLVTEMSLPLLELFVSVRATHDAAQTRRTRHCRPRLR
jgi:hypothetical protein